METQLSCRPKSTRSEAPQWTKMLLLFSLMLFAITLTAKVSPTVQFVLSSEELAQYPSTIDQTFTYPNIDANILQTLNNNDRKTRYKNAVALVMKDHINYAESLEVTLKADLEYRRIDRSDLIKTQITLHLNYHAGALAKSDIENLYTFENAWEVKLILRGLQFKVKDEVIAEDQQAPFAQLIEVHIDFTEDRKTRLDYDQKPTGLASCEDKTTDELVIYWDAMPDAENYELEYTFVDDYAAPPMLFADPNSLAYDFKENSTRITTKETAYRLPLVAEQGYFLYRIRAIGYGDPNLRILVRGEWNWPQDRGKVGANPRCPQFRHTNAHMDDQMNWQSSTTFAEDGKRSDVVTYFDGTFRERQEVTAMNLEPQLPIPPSAFSWGTNPIASCPPTSKVREVIAGETIYDFQGRPAVNILPVPTDDKQLHFIENLNLANADQKPYNWDDFDAASYTCPKTDPLYPKSVGYPAIMGAAVYYSPNNPTQLGFNAFIPNAEKFPFTQVSYLQDNTGRVAAQSGVGKTFQFGANHETRFYYAASTQVELDRMFGTEAGDALRYQKNAVMDPNRQVSVTILNPEGKTIATALAGATPQNLDALPYQTPEIIEESLIHKNQISETDHTLSLEHQFLVTSDDTEYTIDYTLDPELLYYKTCDGKDICLDCIYDFSISLYHNESCTQTPVFAFSGTIGDLYNATGTVDLECNNGTPDFSRHEIHKLKIGTYTLSKTLRVNEAAALAYVAEVFKDTCKDQWNHFLQDIMSKVDTMDCYKTCLKCDEPPVKTDDCDPTYCKPAPNRCDVIRAMMIADMSPGGQYAQVDVQPDGKIDATKYPLSIFNPDNLLPKARLADINALTYPWQYSTLEALYQKWKPEYGEKLLSLHPEYCLFGWCNEPGIDQTLDFDMAILSKEFFEDARTKGYIDVGSTLPDHHPKPYERLLLADPFFKNGQHPNERADLLYKLENYGCPPNATIPADRLAMQVALCAQSADLTVPKPTNPAINLNGSTCTVLPTYFAEHAFGQDFNNPDSDLEDLEWQMLRAIYLSAKNAILQKDMNKYANNPQNRCNIRCIGADDYNVFAALFSHLNYAPCDKPTPFVATYYHDKQSRFGTGVAQIMKAWEDEGIPFDATGITDFDDPCQFAKALLEQSAGINQAVGAKLCGDNPLPCTEPSPELRDIKILFDRIFEFTNANDKLPSSTELAPLVPSLLQIRSGVHILEASMHAELNLILLNLSYGNQKGSQACEIKLEALPVPLIWERVHSVSRIELIAPQSYQATSPQFLIWLNYVGNSGELIDYPFICTANCWPFAKCIRATPCDSLLDTLPTPPYQNECVASLLRIARSNAQLRYRQWEDSLKADLLQQYYAKCMKPKETETMHYEDRQYHYTLYYYDQAGNLVKTVPPAGVRLLDNAQVAAVQASREADYAPPVLPTHYKQTHYHYNTLNELIWQKTPDAGESEFYYDGLGRIVASQNAQQAHDGNFYSYSRYDLQGRMVETGKLESNLIDKEHTRDFKKWSGFIEGLTSRTEMTVTQYDKSWNPTIKNLFRNRKQEYLRKRVASVLKFDDYNKLNTKSYSHATHYTYDIEGNVKELIQDFKNGIIGAKSIAYDYDRQSGKVNEVIYQGGSPDQFIHRYAYDAANRLTQVQTSRDSILWETDATYLYYRHGPLGRMELGTDKVQGLDYLYTLQGWIKGVNGTTETAEYDMGRDGVAMEETGSNNGIGVGVQSPLLNTPPPGYRDMHHPIAKDAFGYVLSYFDGDFSPIEWGATGFANGTTVSFPPNPCLGLMPQPNPETEALYNGNICQMYTQIQGLGNNGFDYRYDQLNRITNSKAWKIEDGTVAMLPNEAYRGTWTYDADGNILNQIRNGSAEQVEMDEMHYWYYDANNHAYDPETPNAPDEVTNRLAYVTDPVPSGNYEVDIDGQDPNNYGYDLIGNLTKDTKENIDKITWNLQNKVATIEKSAGADLVFQYDPLGQRIAKIVTSGAEAENASTYYVRDAQGNIMATYSYRVPLKGTATAKVLYLDEVDIYGSSRLGVDSVGLVMELSSTIHELPPLPLPGSLPEPKWEYLLRERGDVRYELCNHLGNVLAVISDRKLPVSGPKGTYVADVMSAEDYYAFGMVMPGRSLDERRYRFGFNGMEGDDEVRGFPNSYTTEFRQYDTRISRWTSLDPLMSKYPWQSPYAGSNNNPILCSDPTGLEGNNPNEEKQVEGIEVIDNISWSRSNDNSPALPNEVEMANEEIINILPTENTNCNSDNSQNKAGQKTPSDGSSLFTPAKVYFKNVPNNILADIKVIPEDAKSPTDVKDASNGKWYETDGLWIKGQQDWFKIPDINSVIVTYDGEKLIFKIETNIWGKKLTELFRHTEPAWVPDSGKTTHKTDYPFK